ncbi:hypothetical protein NQZ68_018738 [Dissostichus eleginoides]|nr:hypothetical protein NQZ68_018738 [Dissostichus eleginoides]
MFPGSRILAVRCQLLPAPLKATMPAARSGGQTLIAGPTGVSETVYSDKTEAVCSYNRYFVAHWQKNSQTNRTENQKNTFWGHGGERRGLFSWQTPPLCFLWGDYEQKW